MTSPSYSLRLSQFQSVDELPAAFHQIRGLVLEQKLPFGFWDEFDAELAGRSLGWLSSFLAPMQDGDFREGSTPHPIGPAVFIFAGGTSATTRGPRVAAHGPVCPRRAPRHPRSVDGIPRLPAPRDAARELPTGRTPPR